MKEEEIRLLDKIQIMEKNRENLQNLHERMLNLEIFLFMKQNCPLMNFYLVSQKNKVMLPMKILKF